MRIRNGRILGAFLLCWIAPAMPGAGFGGDNNE